MSGMSMTSQAPGATSNLRWWQLVFGVLCMVAAANVQYAWTLFVPDIAKALGQKEAAVQVIFTVFVLFQTWLTPIEGFLIDRYGPKFIVFIGGILTGLAWVLFSYANSLTFFYFAAAIAGIGVGCVYATSVNNAIKWFPDKRGLAVGLTAGAYGAGSAATIIPISRMIESSGYQAAFFWFGIAQGIVIVLASLGLRAPAHGEAAQSQTVAQSRYDYTLGEAARTPVFYVMFAMFILIVAGGLMATAQLKPMANAFGVSKQEVGLWFTTINALNFALLLDRILNGFSRPFFGWISDKIGRENTMLLAFGLEGIGIFALALWGNTPWAFIILSGLVFFAWGEVYSLFSATAADAFGSKNIGSIYGTLYTAKGFGALLVPVSSVVAASYGWSSVLYIVAAMNILAAIAAIVLLKPMLRRHHERSAQLAAAAGIAAPVAMGAASAVAGGDLGQLRADNRALKLKLAELLVQSDEARAISTQDLSAQNAELQQRIAQLTRR